jgi:hypothetical protein
MQTQILAYALSVPPLAHVKSLAARCWHLDECSWHRSCWRESTCRWFTARTTLSLQTRSDRVCSDDPPIHRHVRQARHGLSLFTVSISPVSLSLPLATHPLPHHRRLPSQKARSRLHTTTSDSFLSNHLSLRKSDYAVPCPGTARTSTFTSKLPAQHRPSLDCHLTLRARALHLAMQYDPRQSPAGATDAAGASRPLSFRDAAPHEVPYVRLVVRSNPDTALPISDLPPPVADGPERLSKRTWMRRCEPCSAYPVHVLKACQHQQNRCSSPTSGATVTQRVTTTQRASALSMDGGITGEYGQPHTQARHGSLSNTQNPATDGRTPRL